MWLRGASGSGGLQQDIVGGVGGGRDERRPVGEGGGCYLRKLGQVRE